MWRDVLLPRGASTGGRKLGRHAGVGVRAGANYGRGCKLCSALAHPRRSPALAGEAGVFGDAVRAPVGVSYGQWGEIERVPAGKN